MNRGQYLLRLSFVVMFLVGIASVPLLKALTTLSPMAIFGVSVSAGFVAFVVFGVIVSKLGY
jgi:hypothetical protein